MSSHQCKWHVSMQLCLCVPMTIVATECSDFQRLASFSFSLPTISTWRDVHQCSVSPPTLSLVKGVALVFRHASVSSNYPGLQSFWRSAHFCWENMGRWQTWSWTWRARRVHGRWNISNEEMKHYHHVLRYWAFWILGGALKPLLCPNSQDYRIK